MPVEIRTRFTTGTYVATVRGEKRTASNTISAWQAAEAMARKLGLDPALLRETQRDLLRDGVELFVHPGEAQSKEVTA
ncbi:hypothetical protein C1170_06275 [Stutzerimonas frequens]|uniref:Uncharacterized protein n=1 Tax=Stutzerimonas frequens TaxID=2968969 RepID=A0ABX6XYF2_9GAMM|nr:hypothetical protein [Stutzerimonas frequens]MCQ4302698.1 hypothetical protein [Stutzerimonas frequens]PNF52539.1 hypothetical protein C1170_06275 [Stutzerimonas frequens]QPT19020.1 hypothetical protein I6G34_06580 [Stutzerimonas frequens]